MGERLLCKQEVIGSIPFTSTTDRTMRSIIRVEARQAQLLLRRERPGAERCSEPNGVPFWCGFRRARARLTPLDATRVASWIGSLHGG